MTESNKQTYTIPLRKSFIKVPVYRRAKRAVNTLKKFIVKHMKVEEVKIGPELNKKLWANGIKNPPGKVTVKAIKENKTAKVELEGFEYKTEKVQTEKTNKPKTLKDKLESKLMPKKEEKEEEKQEKETQVEDSKQKEQKRKKQEKQPEKLKNEKLKKTYKKNSSIKLKKSKEEPKE